MGDFSTSKASTNQTQDVNSTTTTDPWGPQAGYLKDIFGKAQQTYGDTAANKYTGDQLAAYRPEQLDLFGKMIGYANTSPIAQSLLNQGQSLGQLGLSNATGALGGLGGFNPLDLNGILAAANQFANDPNIEATTNAVTRDDLRNLTENQLPGVERNAALSGNTNSSRTGAKEAVLQRGYEDRRADVNAGLRANAYNQGIGAATNARDAELARLMGLTGSSLQASQLGSSDLTNSLSSMAGLFGLGNEGASGLQASDQQALSNELAKYAFAQDNAWAPLLNYFNIIGANNWGGTSNTKGTTTTKGTSTQTASPAATIGGLLTSVGSLIPGT